MSEYSLSAEPVLSGFQTHYGDTQLREITGRAIVSMATPKDGKIALSTQLKKAYGVDMPTVGKFSLSVKDNTQVLRIQADQSLVLFDYSGDRAVQAFSKNIDKAYLSDQSDSWAMLRLSGGQSKEALARICAIDLHPEQFSPGSVTRTLMEHISALIICEADNDYTLMALRSFAHSFLHAIQVSIENISE